MKEFSTAARKARNQQETESITFKVDDEELVSIRPREAQLVMLMTAQSSETRDEVGQVADLIDSCMSLFDQESRRHIKRRLLNPEDPEFDLEFLMDLVQELVEEWTNRPTKPLSDSTSSSDNGGTSSEAGASPKELTSSVST